FNLGITTPSSIQRALTWFSPWGTSALGRDNDRSRCSLLLSGYSPAHSAGPKHRRKFGPTSSLARTSSPSAALPSAGSARSAHTAPDLPTPVAGARRPPPAAPIQGR